jgi:hypothetical protein
VDLFYLLAPFQYREVVVCCDFYLSLMIAEALRFCLLSMIAEAVSFCLPLMIDEALLELVIGEGFLKVDEDWIHSLLSLLALGRPLMEALTCHCCLLVSCFPYEQANREANTLYAYDHDLCLRWVFDFRFWTFDSYSELHSYEDWGTVDLDSLHLLPLYYWRFLIVHDDSLILICYCSLLAVPYIQPWSCTAMLRN